MRIKSDGNVGIGTTDPTTMLHVAKSGAAQIQIQNTSGTTRNTQLLFTNSGGTGWRIGSDVSTNNNTDNFQIYKDALAASVFDITSTGNVGIGSTNPLSKLHVLSGTQNANNPQTSGIAVFEAANVTGANAIAMVHTNSAPGADVGGSLGLGGQYRTAASDPLNYAVIRGAKENATDSNFAGYFSVSTYTNGGPFAERMRIDSSGNVGIGTTSPRTLLQVSGANVSMAHTIAASSLMDIRSTAAAGVNVGPILTFSGFYSGSANTSTFASIKGELLGLGDGNSAGGALVFYTANAAGSNLECMRIINNGNVGIGTTSPATKLHLAQASDAATQGLQLTRSNGSDFMRLYMAAGAGNLSDTLIFSSSFAGDVAAIGRNGGAYFAGNVGIGTSSPGAKLHVLGSDTLPAYVATSDVNASYIRFFTGSTTSRGGFGYDTAGAVFLNAALSVANMVILNGGNVGIGTSSPGSILSVNDPGTGLGFTNAASGNFNIGLLAGTGSALAYVYQRANSDLLFGTNNNEQMRITSGGTLLLGTTTTPTSATTGVLAFGAVGTAPSAVSAGGALWVDSSGILKYRNSTNVYTVTIT
jgi:hypothetical protein